MDGEFLILGSRNALEALKPGLEDSARYQNIRHRLPYDATLFAYANTQEVRQAFATSLGELSFVEPGYLESVLRIFPAFGSSLKREGDEWRSESFVAVDKSMLRDSAFFHPSERHKGRFQEFLPQGHAFEWSGVELLELETSLHAHLETLNPAAALVWEQKMQELWSPYFGDVNREAYASFLNGEQSLVWTPSETFVWMLQIEEAERELALELNDHFISNYQSPQMRTVSGGEQQASLEVLNASRENHEGDDYFAIGPEGALTHWVAILDEVVIASNDETEFFETLDRYRGRSDLASMDNRQDMLLGTDHQFSLDMTTLPESHIIRMLLPGIAQWTGSVKLFDDGIYLRALFHS